VKVIRSTIAYNCPAIGAWVDVPNATLTFAVPPLHKDLFIARFAAESAYSGVPSYARLRILINATEMQPASGTDFAFDSNDGGNEGAASWEGHAMERSGSYSTSLFAASPIVKVQCWNPVGGVFRLDDTHFTVEQLH
jgi:hypothetical protein